jgi:hypothetical protein
MLTLTHSRLCTARMKGPILRPEVMASILCVWHDTARRGHGTVKARSRQHTVKAAPGQARDSRSRARSTQGQQPSLAHVS